jgi:hypothetical protein
MSLVNELDTPSSILAIVLSFLMPLVYVFINKIESRINNNAIEGKPIRNLFYIFALMNNISSKHSKFSASRVMITTVLFYTIMITSIFQGTLIKNFNRNQQLKAFAKVDQLIKENYKLTMEKSLAAVMKNQGGSKMAEMLRKISENSNQLFENPLISRNVATKNSKQAYLTTSGIVNVLNQFYDNSTGESLYEYVEETVFEFYISPCAPKNSPFIEVFNNWLMLFKEFGIYDYQLELATNDMKKLIIQRVKNGKLPKQQNKSITFHDLKSIFYLYFMLTIICGFIFIAEKMHNLIAVNKSNKTVNVALHEFVM